VLALAALFLAGAPPRWVRGAGAGAGAAVVAVAAHAGLRLAPASLWLVVVLVGCGAAEVALRTGLVRRALAWTPLPLAVGGTLGALSWTALKVGALSYGGGFVIVPLMQADAVDRHGWMTDGQFLNAVALGQVTPGPVTHTVAAVGYAAAGVGGGLLAAAVAFAPSFVFVLAGATRFDRLRADRRARAFLDGAGPAAIGAILGACVPLAGALQERWQAVVLAVAAPMLLVLGRGVVTTLLAAGAAGALVALAGGPLPR
jgi:chromate transporter